MPGAGQQRRREDMAGGQRLHQQRKQRGGIVFGAAVHEVGRRHRRMKADQALALQQRVQRGDVAVADEGFDVCAQQRGVDVRQQARAAPAAAQAEHGAHVGVGEGGVQVGQAQRVVAGQEVVLRMPRMAARVQASAQTKACEQRLDLRHALGRGRAGGGDHADEITRAQMPHRVPHQPSHGSNAASMVRPSAGMRHVVAQFAVGA